ITFYTVPSWPAPWDPNRVIWNEEKAERLFRAIKEDTPVEDVIVETGRPTAEPSPSTSLTPSYPAEPSPKPTNPEPTPSAAPPDAIEGRDATADPCVNGLGLGTEDMVT
ncbi:hypothetical protein JYB64_24060, partial [Algoriphagus aestuarii]|nr:hypothetical protein [Algoriphagus aestuarii]